MDEVQRLQGNVFLASVVTLAFEVVVFRIFTFLFGYHFVSLLLALALLGYGMSGSLIKKVPAGIKENPLWALSWSTCFFFLGLCLFPFDPYGMFLKPWSFLTLGIFLVLTLSPFFFHGMMQLVAFERAPHLFSRFYGLNLLGSAVGVGVGIVGLFFLEESRMVLVLALSGILGNVRTIWRVIVVVLLAALFVSPLTISLSPYSPSLLLREIPGNRMLRYYRNALEVMEVFFTPSSRIGWGLSAHFTGVPPSSFTLVFDHHATEVFPEDVSVPFLEALLLSLPFRILRPERVLVLEDKGGLEVYCAQQFGSRSIELVTASFLFSSFLQDFVPSFPARVVVASPRRYLQEKKHWYDCIVVRVPVQRASVFPGTFSLTEDFLFTREGMATLLSALKEDGILVFPFFLQNPPSLLPKLVLLFHSVYGSPFLQSSLVVVKNLDFAVLLFRKGGWSAKDLSFWKEEVTKWSFDFVYFPGGSEEECERVFQTGKRYYRVLQEIFQSGSVQSSFDLRPPEDQRPYFGNFFRFSQLRETWLNLGKRWLPFGGAGFLLFIAIFAIVVLFSVVFLIVPVRVYWKRVLSSSGWIFLLGGVCTGIGFMFLEVTLFVRLHLVVGLPLYTFSLLLVVLLLGSGWGSMQIGKKFFDGGSKRWAAYFHLLVMGGYMVLLKLFQNQLFLLFPLFPLAYWSGMPFPILSERVRCKNPEIFPMVFAYNGFFSVISSLLAHFLLFFCGMALVFV
ncbi:MAG: hypothetical protein ABDK92_06630, partial [Atribacterota bacterium]